MKTTTEHPSPEKVMQCITGGWVSAILGSAVRHGAFAHLEDGETAAGLASKAGLSPRGAQALLDGLTGLGLTTLQDGKYRNTPEASFYLIKGKPAYLGAMAEVMMDGMTDWSRLPQAVKTGVPAAAHATDAEDNPFWHELVPAIASLSVPVARQAAEKLGLAKAGPVSWLDVGGGSGVWSAMWLGAARQATGVQLDWPGVNKIARAYVARFGVADRFKTVDGDFHAADFGASAHDYAVYSHIAHQETPDSNVQVFKKLRRALKPGGTLVVNDFVLDDDRTGHPFAMLFASQMVLASTGGFTWRRADYSEWLKKAGFTKVELVETSTPATMVFASEPRTS